MITLSGVGKTYGKRGAQFTALDDISFSVPDAASIAIVGKSGSGKSTLMHVMSGLDRISRGDITIDGQSLGELKPAAMDHFRATTMGFIFQSFFVQGNESCYNNVSLPLEISRVSTRERKRRIVEALEQVDLADKIDVKAKTLSGGQKQRLAIARAIVTRPRLLFADEPTGNLDSVTGARVEELLFGLNKQLGCTLVVITHDPDLAKLCDRQIYLKDGRISKIVMPKEVAR